MTSTELAGLSSNWKKLQAKLEADKKRQAPSNGVKRKRNQDEISTSKKQERDAEESIAGKSKDRKMNDSAVHTSRPRSKSQPGKGEANSKADVESRPSTSHDSKPAAPPAKVNEGVSETTIPGRYIALDCEMVGVGPAPDQDSQLARISLINYHGDQVYDSYVLPQMPVTDYRTPVSGIRRHHLRPGYARPFKEVQKDVSVFLDGRVLVGHAVGNDLKMLMLSHPKRDIRDTARHQPFRERAMGKTPSLRKLAKELLGLDIQTGEHSSIEDARVAMLLYKREKDAFDAEHSRQFGKSAPALPAAQINGEQTTVVKAKKKKKKKKRGK